MRVQGGHLLPFQCADADSSARVEGAGCLAEGAEWVSTLLQRAGTDSSAGDKGVDVWGGWVRMWVPSTNPTYWCK